MIRFKTVFFLSCGLFAAGLNASDVRTVSLSSLLAPLGNSGVEETGKKELAEPVKKAPQTYRVLGLAEILRRMETDLSKDIDPSETLSLTSQFNWRGAKIPVGVDWDVRVETPFNPRGNGRWYPLFELLVDGRLAGEYRIPIQVSHVKDVWVVDQNVSRGGLVNAPVVKSEARDIYAERGSPISASESLANYEASRSLARGQLLTWEDLDKRPHVRKNAIVDVEFTKGALQIRMRGRAMEDGMHGDLITIRNLNTSREFIAQVHGENRVRFQN